MTAQPDPAAFAAPAVGADAAPSHPVAAIPVSADARPTPLPLRHDTFLGICEGLGGDLGFHPNWLRVALALGLFYSPVGAVLAYLGLGVLVAATRLIAPDEVVTAPTASAAAVNENLRLHNAA